jgi:putative colanic acid biosynthesis glycosyltransferase WcaI
VDVVENGVDECFYRWTDGSVLRARLGLGESFVVSYIGTHGMAHGLETVIEAAERLRTEPVRFLLVGAGARKDTIRALAGKKRLENVIFLPPQPRDEMPHYWALSDATVVPLRRDPVFRTTVPSKIFEAMAMGVPILLGVDGEAKELVQRTGSGLYYPPEDSASLAKAIIGLMKNARLRSDLRVKASSAALDYSRDRLAAKMLAILHDVGSSS